MSNEFSFLEVKKVEVEQLPELIKKDVYKNQNLSFDMGNIKKQTGLIIGCGSVGSNVINTLNKFGFSSFQVYDFDIWEAHNSASSIFPYQHCINEKGLSSHTYQQWLYYPNDLYLRNSPENSIFKVDLLKQHLMKNDKQTHIEVFRVPFGVPYNEAMKRFLDTLPKIPAKVFYDVDGIRTDSSRNRGSPTSINLVSKYKPDYMVLTTDNLQSRLKAVSTMRGILKIAFGYTDVFPIIDVRTLDTVKGEVYLFDLFNDEDYLKWVNTTIPPKDHFETLEDYEKLIEIYDNWDILELLDLTATNVCGEKMSVLVSQQMAVTTTNLLANIFREKDKINLEGLPKESYINTSMFKPYYAVSKEFTEV